MILTRDQILNSKDIETKAVSVPEWGGEVLVRALSLKEANEWRKSMLKPVPTVDKKSGKTTIDLQFDQQLAEMANVWMVSIAVVDESGNRVFSSADIEALSGKSLAPIARIVETVMEISGLNQKAADDAEKNSEPNPSESSSSD